MTVEVATYVGDLDSTKPPGGDPKSEGDNHIRLMKSVLQSTFPGLGGRAWRTQQKASNYNLASTDNMTVVEVTAGSVTIGTAAALATLGNGFAVLLYANGFDVTFDPNGSETINDGASTSITLHSGDAMLVLAGPSEWLAVRMVGSTNAVIDAISTDSIALNATSTPTIVAGTIKVYQKLVSGINRLMFRSDSGSDQEFWSTGDVKDTFAATEPTGWLFLSGKTIGDASSGATARANADCEALFTLLWTNLADAQAPVSGGRGANAAADWAAHKTLTLPDARGRVSTGKDDMGGTSANRLTATYTGGLNGDVLGNTGGEEAHTQQVAELATHHHTEVAASGGGSSFSSLTAVVTNSSGPVASTTQDTGSSTPMNVVQPTLVVNRLIKL